jgi:hypothetical protein
MHDSKVGVTVSALLPISTDGFNFLNGEDRPKGLTFRVVGATLQMHVLQISSLRPSPEVLGIAAVSYIASVGHNCTERDWRNEHGVDQPVNSGWPILP